MSLGEFFEGHGSRLLRFFSIGAVGSLVNLGVVSLAFGVLRAPYALATALAIETSILFNFTGHYHVTFRDRRGSWLRKLATFQAVSLVAASVAWLTMNALALAFGTPTWWIADAWTLIGIGIGFCVNYALNVTITWRRPVEA